MSGRPIEARQEVTVKIRNTIVVVFAIIGVVASVRELTGQNAGPMAGAVAMHVGIMVHEDVDQTAKRFQEVFGVTVPPARASGPISWPDNPAGPGVQWSVKLTSFPLGGLTIELVEPVSGPGPHRAHLDRFGQGLHHIAFGVDDPKSAFAFLRSKGGTQVSSTYVDMKDLLGFTVEPMARPAR